MLQELHFYFKIFIFIFSSIKSWTLAHSQTFTKYLQRETLSWWPRLSTAKCSIIATPRREQMTQLITKRQNRDPNSARNISWLPGKQSTERNRWEESGTIKCLNQLMAIAALRAADSPVVAPSHCCVPQRVLLDRGAVTTVAPSALRHFHDLLTSNY